MKEYIKQLYDEMQDNLHLLTDPSLSAVQRLKRKLDYIIKATDDLKKYIDTDPFNTEQEEIQFFKCDKPLFAAQHFLAQYLFTIESQRRQLNDNLLIKEYYERELRFIRHYFEQNQFLYKYFQLEATELDGVLFLRGAETSPVILPETPDLDAKFSTAGDYLFAKFIAYEQVQEYLANALYPSIENEKLKKALNWTGDKINLIEIAYGIYDTTQLNDGDVDIIDIINWLEESLNVNLSRHYRMFSEMKSRKSISLTRYLDHMKYAVTEHLELGDAFRPIKPNTVSGSKSKAKK